MISALLKTSIKDFVDPAGREAAHLIHEEIACCVQGDKVKKGQVVAYVEQLGTYVPIEVSCMQLLPCVCCSHVQLMLALLPTWQMTAGNAPQHVMHKLLHVGWQH